MNKSSKKLLLIILGIFQSVPVIKSMDQKKPIVGKHPRSYSLEDDDFRCNKKPKVDSISFDFRGPGLSEYCVRFGEYTERNLDTGNPYGNAKFKQDLISQLRLYQTIYEYSNFEDDQITLDENLLEKLRALYSTLGKNGNGKLVLCHYVNHMARLHGEQLSVELNQHSKYKFITVLFNKAKTMGGQYAKCRIQITDFGDNAMKNVSPERTQDPYLVMAWDPHFLAFAQVLWRTTVPLIKNGKHIEIQKNSSIYQLSVLYSAFNGLADEEKRTAVKLLNKLVNKELTPDLLRKPAHGVRGLRADMFEISLRNFSDDNTELTEYQNLSPQCKRLVLHILGGLLAMSVNLDDGGLAASGVVNRELSKIDSSIQRKTDKYDAVLNKIKQAVEPKQEIGEITNAKHERKKELLTEWFENGSLDEDKKTELISILSACAGCDFCLKLEHAFCHANGIEL